MAGSFDGRARALTLAIIVTLTAGVARAVTWSAGAEGAETPEAALEAYYAALEADDCAEAARYVDPGFLTEEELCAEFEATREASGSLEGVASTEVQGDEAVMIADRRVGDLEDQRVVRAVRERGLWRLAGGSSCFPEERPTDLGGAHLEPGQDFDDYSSFPPTSGPHDPQPARSAAVYENTPPLPQLVHSMEHGAVIFWVSDDAPQGFFDGVSSVVQELFEGGYVSLILTRVEGLTEPLAITAWGTLQRCLGIAPAEIREFVQAYYASGLEGELACAEQAASVPPCRVQEA